MSGKNPVPNAQAYEGVKATTPPNLTTSTADPSNSIKSDLGSFVLNKTSGALFYKKSSGWQNISGGAGSFSSLAVSGDETITGGNLILATAGKGILIKTGTNATMGTSAAMTAGTITISTTAVTSSSIIFLTVNTPGGTQGTLSAPTASIVAGTSFVINSSSNTDTSTVNWLIVNPAP
jgi:hypothetical protein